MSPRNVAAERPVAVRRIGPRTVNVLAPAGSILDAAVLRAAVSRQSMHAELVERAKRGDRDAFASIAAASVDRCYALAYRILRDHHRAQDAAQQALLGVWRDLPTLRDVERFDAWLHRLVVHACYVEARGERRWTARVRVMGAQPGDTPDIARSVTDRDELERAFRLLTPEHRAVVVLHHHLGYQLTEIAEVLGIPAGTARSRLHNAVRQLRATLENDQVSSESGERTA
jgi:RNA polymerase sigma-70 factor (ECF subfamily)